MSARNIFTRPARLVAEQAGRRDARFAEVADATFDTTGAGADRVVSALQAAIPAARPRT